MNLEELNNSYKMPNIDDYISELNSCLIEGKNDLINIIQIYSESQ